ncbi:MAG: putative kinase domain protein [Streblomastix strix]|uniref:non-specific serine/threonine protein kinase n=1 Tax=Streblomastix strix TaxID=222440 RepID=A0A5J4WRP7_9EUKA|nr:MAG: putative kinase domain protein [Streblomastix strix]
MPRYEDYRVIRQLPGGAQSKTYLVELKSTHQQFIMKKVSYLEDVDRAKVDVEIELMQQLDSDFTVHLVCTVETDVDLCMILEYCVRGDFRNLIDEFQQLPQSEKLMRGWEYTAQIARALDHLHSHNVMHRDLKPANILVNQDGSIRLGDFGLAREMNDDYYLTIAGTKVYMAPEVHLLKRMDMSSEMFSFGAIIFQLITGHHPFEADSEEAMDPSHRPTTKMILSHDTVQMYLRLIEGRKLSRQNEIALTERDRVIQERNRLQNDNERVSAERDRLQVELDREKRRADSIQVQLARQIAKTDSSQELVRIFQSQVETTQTENQRLTAEVTRLNHELSRRETILATPKAQPKQTPTPTLKPKQALLQIISSSQPITVNLNVPIGMNGHKEQNIFIHDITNNACTISTNPVISDGIVYFETVFENHEGLQGFGIGIADSSVVFQPNKGPWEDGNKGKTIRYRDDGWILHINQGPINQSFKCEYKVGLEVNMSSNPRKLTFFVNDVEQKNYVINIPYAIRFWAYIWEAISSFTVTKFEKRSSSSSHGIAGSRSLEWGQYQW